MNADKIIIHRIAYHFVSVPEVRVRAACCALLRPCLTLMVNRRSNIRLSGLTKAFFLPVMYSYSPDVISERLYCSFTGDSSGLSCECGD
jgi:hypothetical protein